MKALPVPEFPNVFEAVLEGRAAFGIVPIENSLTGSIHQNYDLLLQYPDIRIVGEQKIRIEHNLIALPQAKVEDIRRVYSHPQGLAQCSRFLDEHPRWERVAFYDTAGAARFVAEKASPENAAIASAEAAAVYGLSVLRQGLETNVQNYTRFFVIARETETQGPPGPREKGKASFCFSVADQPGALFRALQVLADQGLNMKKLESRPILGKPWQYLFYIDVDLPVGPRGARSAAWRAESAVTEDLRVLGTYGQDEVGAMPGAEASTPAQVRQDPPVELREPFDPPQLCPGIRAPHAAGMLIHHPGEIPVRGAKESEAACNVLPGSVAAGESRHAAGRDPAVDLSDSVDGK